MNKYVNLVAIPWRKNKNKYKPLMNEKSKNILELLIDRHLL